MRWFVAVLVALGLASWWYFEVGLKNKAENESRVAMRELMDALPTDVATHGFNRQVYSRAEVEARGAHQILYTFQYRAQADRTSTPEERAATCTDNSKLANKMLPAMKDAGITDPQVRIEYVHITGALDFACQYPTP